jgi:hypothetical protein
MSHRRHKRKPFRVSLSALEFVSCDECRTRGHYRELAPNKFRCTVCGTEFETAPCNCGKQHSGGTR